MTDFNEILDSEIDPGSPLNTSLFSRLARNPLAIAEGDVSAPPIRAQAMTRVAAGSVPVRTDPRTSEYYSTSWTAVYSWVLYGSGVVRVSVESKGSNNTYKPNFRITKNGVVVALWEGALTAYEVREADVSFVAGDLLQWEQITTLGNAAYKPYSRNFTLKTAGELPLVAEAIFEPGA